MAELINLLPYLNIDVSASLDNEPNYVVVAKIL